MQKKFNVSGEQRKEMVRLIGEGLGIKPRYCGMPSCAYEIGDLTVDKDGAVTGVLSDDLLQLLTENGFYAEHQAPELEPPITGNGENGMRASSSAPKVETDTIIVCGYSAPPSFYFASDAKAIQHYVKLILSDRKPHQAKQLKMHINSAISQRLTDGAYAGALRDLVTSDCQYTTDGRGAYQYVPFEGNEEVLPFVTQLSTCKAILQKMHDKVSPKEFESYDMVYGAIEKLGEIIKSLSC